MAVLKRVVCMHSMFSYISIGSDVILSGIKQTKRFMERQTADLFCGKVRNDAQYCTTL